MLNTLFALSATHVNIVPISVCHLRRRGHANYSSAPAGVAAAFAAAAAAIPTIESKVRGCTYLDIEQ